MVRAFGRPALPVLLALGICTATARGGVMSVAEVPPDGGGALVNPSVIVRITSSSFQSQSELAPDSSAGTIPRSQVSAFSSSDSTAIGSTLTPPDGYLLAGRSTITMAGRSCEVHYFTVSGEMPVFNFPTGNDVDEAAAPNPEPGSIALFGIGAVGLVGYVWQKRRRFRNVA